MAAQKSAVASIDQVEAGFAKLHGENFVYFIQKYSVMLGRNTESYSVDFDLSKYERGGQHVSRHHARIFYDSNLSHFAIEVIGRSGCTIRGVFYLPGDVPIKLNSLDLIEIAGIKFYFLLLSRSIHATFAARRTALLPPQSSSTLNPTDYPGHPSARDSGNCNGVNGAKISNDSEGTLVIQNRSFSGELDISNCYGNIHTDPVGRLSGCVSMLDIQSAQKDTDNQKLLLEEENDVVTCIVAVISDLSGPSKWVPMEKLHTELFERFGKDRPHGKVSRYLAQKGTSSSSTEAYDRPWCNLWTLFRKYPDHFVMSTIMRGQDIISEYVGLVHQQVSVANES